MPVYCLDPKDKIEEEVKGSEYKKVTYGTWIRKGDKIGQFRVMEVMPEIEFEEVDFLTGENRGGFGTTGVK